MQAGDLSPYIVPEVSDIYSLVQPAALSPPVPMQLSGVASKTTVVGKLDDILVLRMHRHLRAYSRQTELQDRLCVRGAAATATLMCTRTTLGGSILRLRDSFPNKSGISHFF